MAKPYSQDLRDRVIGAVDSGISARAASRLFGISESTGIKWVARWRRTGSIGAKRMGGYKRSPLDSHVDLIVELITEQSDLTVEEIRSALRERGIRTGHGSVRRFFDRHGISFKKKPCSPANKTERTWQLRANNGARISRRLTPKG